MCHAREPGWEGLLYAPRGVLLEEDYQIAARARQIYLWAGRSNAMPPGNVSFMEEDERRMIVDWFESVVAGKDS
jgi:uncharacterized membrane protein